MVRKRKYTINEKIKRLFKMKLVIPVLRSPLSSEVKALGVAVGLFWAMTPLVGIQMWLVFMTWVFFKKVLHKDFSLVLGVAYTWVTNVLTMIPVYYVFYITGQIIKGDFFNISGYSKLTRLIEENFMGEISFVDKWLLLFKIMLKDWGVSMIIGCLPWAVIFSIVGYRLTLKFGNFRTNRIQKKSFN